MNRAAKKIPPFQREGNSSDKGFKDTLVWLSILEYFKSNGENEVIFVSDDNGFRKETETLYKEFEEHTGKTITMKGNNFYDNLVLPQPQPPERNSKKTVPYDMGQIREKIYDAVNNLCGTMEYSWNGDEYWQRTFTLNKQVDGTYMEVVFSHLKQDIEKNLLSTSMQAGAILDLDDRTTNCHPISMESLESVLAIFDDIKLNMPEYLPQFYNASAAIINNDFNEPTVSLPYINDDDLPF